MSEFQTTSPLPNHEYLGSLGEARTARHASETYYASPDPRHVASAVSDIRRDVSSVFRETSPTESPVEIIPLEERKENYWNLASRVTPKSGAIPGYELEDYLRVGKSRSYEEIKQIIEREYAEDSIPRSVLDGIDAYHMMLQINPAHATTIMMEMIGRNLKAIQERADTLGGKDSPQAVRQAFSQFITDEVPPHIESIINNYGVGDDNLQPNMYRASLYPSEGELKEQTVTLALSEIDAAGLVEVYDIQSRPYNQQALKEGGDIAQLPAMQAAMIRVQEALIAMSRSYLEKHPERASGNLQNFSEIFVPEYDEDGSLQELLPNPKLLRAMVNNVMPAVALALRRQHRDVETLDVDAVSEGVRIAAEEYKLFQSRIGQFGNYNEENQTVELSSTFRVVCPANAIFPKFLTEKLAGYFEEENKLLRG